MNAATIYARASGPGAGGVAVIRVSGLGSREAVKTMVGVLPTPRFAHFTGIRHPQSDILLDRGLVLWFPGPASYTGEDMVEFQVHGGPAVVTSILNALGTLTGFRLAEAGEFTRRAFQNGKMDLTAAEGVADLIAAETAAQQRQALGQMAGSLGAQYDHWRAQLISLSAFVEAEIDFSEEDLPDGINATVSAGLNGLMAEIDDHLDDGGRGERLRDGLEIVIVGAPNAGKSSLLNLLAKRDVAIVSEEAGTTRDMLEVRLDLKGYPVTLVDTAGLRETENQVESEGVRRATQRAKAADFRLILVDGTGSGDIPDLASKFKSDVLKIVSKSDLPVVHDTQALKNWADLSISVVSGAGIDNLITLLGEKIADRFDGVAGSSLTRARHRQALERCVAHLRQAQNSLEAELVAEEMRQAAVELGRITGRVDVEEILDVVFGEFCIGK